MFYKFIKLSSGDSIIASTEDNCETFENKEFIEISNPVQVEAVRVPKGTMLVETHLFLPWIAMSATDTYKLPTRSIIVTVDVDVSVVKQYESYIAKYSRKTSDQNDEESEEYFYEEECELDEEEDDGNSDQRQLH